LKRAILLLNMGGANSKDDVEVFLWNMFNDKRIMTVKYSFLRSMIAKFIIWSRSSGSKKNLDLLGGKSPLLSNTKKLLKKLNRKDRVEAIMRYTSPFSTDILPKLKEDGIEKLILFPLYPQYSTTTTLSSFEDIYEKLAEMNWGDVSICTIKPYYNDPNFLDLIAKAIKKEVSDPSDTNLIFSAHSLPQKIIDAGDPYLEHVEKQVEELKQILPQFKSVHLAFQSKLGPVKWLEPALDKKIHEFKDEKVVVYPISFTIDNVETDFELNIEYREEAEKIGLKEYKVVKVQNDSEEFVQYILNKVSEES
jgi:ferrochelatase